ncbi:MAG: hybrid sensor histidine kinase/response regulator [Chloroflexota bacterium]
MLSMRSDSQEDTPALTRILVIEDDLQILDNIAETLEIEAFDVFTASTGEDGIQAAIDHQPDLILCDIMMPGLSGYDVLRELQAHAHTRTIPFIFLTALGSRSAIRQGMQLGADDYITKPFTPMELISGINARLNRVSTRDTDHRQELETLRNSIIFALPHEFRTPLNGILGCADWLSSEAEHLDRSTLRRMGGVIIQSANRLNKLVESYLLYAQIEILARTPEQLARMQNDRLDYPVSVIADMCEQAAQSAGRAGDLKLDLENAVIRFNHENFAKVIQELIDNALKFSSAGSPVNVMARADAHVLRIAFTNYGRGMAPDEIQRIGAYVQFNRHIYEQQGLGLGLIVSKRMVELYGGQLVIHSVPDDETTVTIELPRHQG